MKLPVRLLFLLLTLLCFLSVYRNVAVAQSTASRGWDYDVAAVRDDTPAILFAPLQFDVREWLFVAASMGVFASAHAMDGEVRALAQAPSYRGWDVPLLMGDLYGNGRVAGGLGAGIYTVGALAGDDHMRITGRMVMQSVIYSGIIMHGLKIIAGRPRPEEGEGKSAFHLFRFDDRYFSFPSGHAMVAFAVSTTLSQRIGSVPVTLFLFGLSGLTVVQRLADDRHWFSDTVVGATLGGAIGLAVVRAEERRSSEAAADLVFQEGLLRHVPLYQWSIAF
ncbi:MAG: phosphatase PAP2 family protein [Bacteroidetes bacterium]|nr:phosphatase PAP2 family protein [Bacteroidota bacterium]